MTALFSCSKAHIYNSRKLRAPLLFGHSFGHTRDGSNARTLARSGFGTACARACIPCALVLALWALRACRRALWALGARSVAKKTDRRVGEATSCHKRSNFGTWFGKLETLEELMLDRDIVNPPYRQRGVGGTPYPL